MQKGTDGGANPESDFFHTDFGYSNRMQDIGLPAFPAHGFMGLCSHFKSIPDQVLIARFELGLQDLEQ